MKITINITEDQRHFLDMIQHQDAATNLSESVQWCIDSCMRIEKNYGDDGGQYDACYVAFHDIRKEGHPEFAQSEQKTAEEILDKYVTWYFDMNELCEKILILKAMEEFASQFKSIEQKTRRKKT